MGRQPRGRRGAGARDAAVLTAHPHPVRRTQDGVDWSALRGSPPEAMVETLQWLRSTYGAIDLYLEQAQCGNEWRDVLLSPPALHGRNGWS